MDGGNGIDGETVLSWLDPVEMGGTLLLEAVGVTLSPGSTGEFWPASSSGLTRSRMHRGFQATAQQGTGAVTLQPMIQGNARRERAYAVNPANQYTLRVRVHCPEMRAGAGIYRSLEIAEQLLPAGSRIQSGQDATGDSGVCERRGRDAGDAL
jgi:hypothetical protein